ncbi:hypothetical protein MMC10_005596 [Thelotrema lepadinum]|nr:hypothetical protein [Thelotrema lepadinum]
MLLAGLPPEVRDIIWEKLFAENYIHIDETPFGDTTHYLCSTGVSDFALHNIFYESTDSPVTVVTSQGPISIITKKNLPPGQAWVASGLITTPSDSSQQQVWPEPFIRGIHGTNNGWWARNHNICRYFMTEMSSSFQLVQNRAVQLHLAPMRTCKLFYKEIFATLWTRNTFAFDCEAEFHRFVGGRTDEQRRTLRHIALKATIPTKFLPGFQPDQPRPHVSAIMSLVGLKTVYISTVVHMSDHDLADFRSHGVLKARDDNDNIIDALRISANLDTILTHVSWIRTPGFVPSAEGYTRHDNKILSKNLGEAIDCSIMSGEGEIQLKIEAKKPTA